MGPDDYPDLDYVGMAEDEVEDKETNVSPEAEDITPDNLENEGDLI